MYNHSTFALLGLLIVICSHSILLTCGTNEDDFSEFDDFSPGEKVEDIIDLEPVEHVEVDSSKKREDLTTEQNQANTGSKLNDVPPRAKSKIRQSEDKLGARDEKDEAVKDGKKRPDLKLVDAPLPGFARWDTYYVEIAFLLTSTLYLVSFFVGCNTNSKVAHEWYEQSRDLLKQQFALVGGAPQIDSGHKKNQDDETDISALAALKKQRGLIKASESNYTIWCSGRAGVDGLLIELNLLKRQDLFSMAINSMKNVNDDNLILRFLLPNDAYENFVFCLAHKSHAVKLARDMIDIATFCPKRKQLSQMGLPLDKLYVMSELTDVCSAILDHSTVNVLKKFERSINYIHITDQYSTIRSEDVSPMQRLASPKRLANFSFNLPKSQTDRAELLLFATSLLDRLRRFKLARDSKQKSDKNRQKITDFLQKTAFSARQEAAQAKKDELRRQEKERIYQEDDPIKQQRWEKKEAKREAKKKMRGVKQLKIRS